MLRRDERRTEKDEHQHKDIHSADASEMSVGVLVAEDVCIEIMTTLRPGSRRNSLASSIDEYIILTGSKWELEIGLRIAEAFTLTENRLLLFV